MRQPNAFACLPDGYEFLITLVNLEKLGMLRRRESTWMASGSSFSTARRTLRLIDETVNVMAPQDCSYVSSGYAPLSVRLVQQAVSGGGWPSVFTSTLQHLPKPALEFSQTDEPALLNVKDAEGRMARAAAAPGAAAAAAGGTGSVPHTVGEKKVMVVYYIGGVSFMEIAALRFLSNKPDCETSLRATFSLPSLLFRHRGCNACCSCVDALSCPQSRSASSRALQNSSMVSAASLLSRRLLARSNRHCGFLGGLGSTLVKSLIHEWGN